MDNIRLLLIMALVFVSLLIWEAWQEDYVVPQQQAEQRAEENSERQAFDTPDVPANAPVDLASAGAQSAPSNVASTGASRVEILTDTLDLEIDTQGASVVDAQLVQYPVSLDTPDIKYHLMSERPSDFFIAQTGLLGSDKERTPTHQAIFTSEQSRYVMGPDDQQLVVDFHWQSPDGVQVTKRYTFTRGLHSVQVQTLVENGSDQPWSGREYRQLQRGEPASGGNALMYTYTGSAIYTPEDKYKKYSFDKLSEGQPDQQVTDGWIAMIQHYFLAAFVPPREQSQHFYGKGLSNNRFVIGTYTPAQTLQPGEQGQFDGVMFIGPKLQEELESIATGLDLTVDYGLLAPIAKPMHWVLEWIHDFVGNWGWTIIIFTILIKGVFFKLSETSYRSMANMRKLGPRIQALKDRYGDDKQRMQQAMMDIYKKEKINPLGGCLPMLIQIPFFIALYWVLLESVEMRQAPWILWIHDLSVKDPYFVLPIIMAGSMFIQQKLNPAPPDPMQAKIMQMLPLVFGVMFAFFPAGLVLYWVVNNLLSIAQQWVITRRIEAGEKA